ARLTLLERTRADVPEGLEYVKTSSRENEAGGLVSSSALHSPPSFCQYANGPCDQDFENVTAAHATFLYASEPENIAGTIEAAIEQLRRRDRRSSWVSWKDIRSTGQIIFCTVCKSMRFSQCVTSDVTTLNFNLLFEIGFALGLEVPVVPIRDTTILTNQDEFRQLGFLDTVGYLDFQNSDELAQGILERAPFTAIPSPRPPLNHETPVYVIRGHIQTDGDVRMMSTLKK